MKRSNKRLFPRRRNEKEFSIRFLSILIKLYRFLSYFPKNRFPLEKISLFFHLWTISQIDL
jgi:hypothetical protein